MNMMPAEMDPSAIGMNMFFSFCFSVVFPVVGEIAGAHIRVLVCARIQTNRRSSLSFSSNLESAFHYLYSNIHFFLISDEKVCGL